MPAEYPYRKETERIVNQRAEIIKSSANIEEECGHAFLLIAKYWQILWMNFE